MASGDSFDRNNSEFKVKSDNSQLLNIPDKSTGNLVFGDKSGTVSISLEQGKTYDYTNSSFSRTFTVVRGNKATNTMYIRNAEEWKLFAHLVNKEKMSNLNVKLDGDINLGKEIVQVGINGIVNYSGTFDGQGHTISLDWNTTHGFTALFNSVNGATIKNLHTKGVITNYVHFTSGLVMIVYGSVTLSNCVSEVNFNHTTNERECFTAGLISFVKADAQVTINDCIVKGKILPSAYVENVVMDGFVGPQEGGSVSTLNNCLYIDSNPRDHTGTVSFGKIIVNNCYSLSDHSVARYTQVNAEQLKSGEVAYKLQAGRSNRVWGQTLGTDDTPWLTDLVERHVNKVDFTYNGNLMLTRYANTGKGVYGGMPTFTAKDLVGSKHNPHHYYKMGLEGGFSASTPVNADRTVAINLAEKDYYEIASKDNWIEFRYIVSSGQNAVDAKMTANVDLGSDIFMVGDSYAGTFDGQNHTLKINWNNTSGWLAPFYTVNGATIKNLRTEGEIKSNSHFLSGLVQSAYGNTTISGCVSAVNITSTYGNASCDAAGMVECVRDNANVTFTDCLVKGKLNATTEKGKESMGGFVHLLYGKCALNNCLYIGENNGTKWSRTFAPYSGSTLNNCYYLNACGDAQGKKVTADQLKSGEVAYLLQNKRAGNFWGQELGKENDPLPTDKAEKHVYKVDFTYNDQVKATRYANTGKAIFGDMPTVTPQFLLGSGYNFHHYYRYGVKGSFSASTPVNADRTVGLFVEDRDYYEIASNYDWRMFCDLVRNGQNGVDAKMTADINLSSDFAMVGSDEHRYAGTFDGQGHTLTISWDSGSKPWVAPFNTVEGATIKNLRTAGNINSSTHFLSGLVCDAYGNTTISDCNSDVDITSTYNDGGCDAAGLVQCVRENAKVTIIDCLVRGKIDATMENGKKYMGGFVNNQYGKCALISCLYLGENNATGGNTFASNSSSGSSTTLKNCYYFKACGKPQGEQATEKQLKSGYVTNKLQDDRTDQCHWAQTLGERPNLYNPADKGKMNYVYHDGDKWACGDFYFTDDKPLPIGLDFTAATVIYQRSFSFAGMSGTICLPYELPVQRFRAYTLSGGQGNKLYFKEVTGTLEAYKPYYITGLGVNPTLSGNNMQVKAFHDDNLTTTATTGHSMTGTVEGVDNATAAGLNAYILQNDGDFHKVTTEYPNAMVPAYHTYIICPKASAGAKQLSVILDGEATGIHGVTNSATDGPVYDLQGRRVADRLDDNARHQLPAGVYIVGGRKVVVK
nr:peptidase M26 [Prevotella illustrans]